ncbi:hypothetical protein V6N13_109864 [Hibiscus sabdariffa]
MGFSAIWPSIWAVRTLITTFSSQANGGCMMVWDSVVPETDEQGCIFHSIWPLDTCSYIYYVATSESKACVMDRTLGVVTSAHQGA